MPVQFFRNKVIANLSELYAPDNFAETIEVAKIAQEIVRLTRPNAWEFASEKSDHMATNIVSNGLFSFLREGLISANQMWVFICCCYVTITIIVQLILPAPLAQAMQYLGIGGIILNKIRKIGNVQNWRTKAKPRKIKAADKSQAVIQIEEIAMTQAAPKSILKKEPIKEKGESVPVPLIKRWPSPKSMPQTSQQTEREETEGRIARGNKNVTIAVAGTGKCDEKFRIIGKANDWGISLLLDTGAHVTLCGKNFALKLDLRKLEASDIVAVIRISDKLIPILGKAEINLQIAGCALRTTVYVVETKIGGEGSYDMIIGRRPLGNCLCFWTSKPVDLYGKLTEKYLRVKWQKNVKRQKPQSKIRTWNYV
ncbi:hypothetical protein niasHT_033968 [Heterodera trifolii]|uniref:Peptidase A2 domain-containing protein n=1 Tax=Heterodera trifolii TaxID=157864 RepID=A0ABD2IJJ8_9BILA